MVGPCCGVAARDSESVIIKFAAVNCEVDFRWVISMVTIKLDYLGWVDGG
jgi:hypothetical protein